jgi:hypothetical protein
MGLKRLESEALPAEKAVSAFVAEELQVAE